MDIIFLDGKAVRHVVDTASKFSGGTGFIHTEWITDSPSTAFWIAFVSTWCLAYTGYTNRLRTYQGSAFTSDCWRQLADTNRFQLRLSVIETLSSRNVCEKYHNPLCRINRKIRFLLLSVYPPYLFRVATKAMNETIIDNGLVLSGHIHSFPLGFPILNTSLHQQ